MALTRSSNLRHAPQRVEEVGVGVNAESVSSPSAEQAEETVEEVVPSFEQVDELIREEARKRTRLTDPTIIREALRIVNNNIRQATKELEVSEKLRIDEVTEKCRYQYGAHYMRYQLKFLEEGIMPPPGYDTFARDAGNEPFVVDDYRSWDMELLRQQLNTLSLLTGEDSKQEWPRWFANLENALVQRKVPRTQWHEVLKNHVADDMKTSVNAFVMEAQAVRIPDRFIFGLVRDRLLLNKDNYSAMNYYERIINIVPGAMDPETLKTVIVRLATDYEAARKRALYSMSRYPDISSLFLAYLYHSKLAQNLRDRITCPAFLEISYKEDPFERTTREAIRAYRQNKSEFQKKSDSSGIPAAAAVMRVQEKANASLGGNTAKENKMGQSDQNAFRRKRSFNKREENNNGSRVFYCDFCHKKNHHTDKCYGWFAWRVDHPDKIDVCQDTKCKFLSYFPSIFWKFYSYSLLAVNVAFLEEYLLAQMVKNLPAV